MKKRIVFITDCIDVAYNELRGVLFSELSKLNSQEEINIEPVVPVERFSIINGNFILRLMAEAYSENTIFSVILNPTKERPPRLIGKTKDKNFYFIGADTGVFDWFLRDFGVQELYELKDPGFFPFGGKYVHAPALLQIALGKKLEDLGNKIDINNFKKLNIIDGTIVHVDNFGLMKFTGNLSNFKDNDRLTVEVAGKVLPVVYTKRMMSRDTGEWVMYPGSSLGLPELGKVRSDGAREIGAQVGDVITIRSFE